MRADASDRRAVPPSPPGGAARFLPVPRWVRGYPRRLLRGDVVAGVTVAVMLVPQAMAYANLAGMPPVTGLYAALAAIVAYALLGTSGSLAVGPVAITSLITLSGLSTIVSPDDPSYPVVAALLAVTVGGILLAAGVLRLGFLVDYLSHPVISGFTSAAAITIGISQVKDLLGVQIGRPEGVPATIAALWDQLGATETATAALGASTVVGLVLLRRFAPVVPAALLAVVVTTLVSWWADLPARGVAIVGDVPAGLPGPVMPELDLGLVRDLLPVALTIAVVAYAEGVSIAKALARRTRDRIDADRELVATGAANVSAGLFGGFPVAGGFSRTAVNHQAGARTPLASMVTAVGLAVTLLWLTPLLHNLPLAALAAIVVVAVAGLVDVRGALEITRVDRRDAAALAVTFGTTLLVGIEAGLAVGVVVSLLLFVHRSANPHTTELGRVSGTTEYRNVDRWPTACSEDVAVLRVDAPLFFANAGAFDARIRRLLADRPGLRYLVLDASGIGGIDASGVHLLTDIDRDLATSGVELHLATVRGPVRDALERADTWAAFEGRVHPSITAAVTAVEPHSPLLDVDAAENDVELY
ncbi:MAG: sulfate permease [Acidimicrobiia bacterium]|nr:sulfate permease [Acidimicrobiia bacterium]